MSDFFPPWFSIPLLPASLWLPTAALAAVLLDRFLGELPRFHPLVGFGAFVDLLEKLLNPSPQRGDNALESRFIGLLAWGTAVLPWVALAAWLTWPRKTPINWLFDTLLLYFALGGRSLTEHAERVARDLAAGNLAAARRHVGWIVSRRTDDLDKSGVARAAVESTLENGNDAIFGTLFWFALFGGAGAVLFRLANTLDAMWGYKNERFLHFGWAAARIDDVLNFIPARLTALSYAVCGNTRQALDCWRQQASGWESPNAGPVMAAGAGSLGVVLGGAAIYHGNVEERPPLGVGRPPRAEDIFRAIALVRHSLMLWVGLFLLGGALIALRNLIAIIGGAAGA